MTTLYTFDPIIYPYPLIVSKDFDAKDLEKTFYLVQSKTALVEAGDAFEGAPTEFVKPFFVANKDSEELSLLILIYRESAISTGTITHESIHLANYLAEWLGFGRLTVENDEPFCYLAGWFADCIQSVIKGRPRTMKGETAILGETVTLRD